MTQIFVLLFIFHSMETVSMLIGQEDATLRTQEGGKAIQVTVLPSLGTPFQGNIASWCGTSPGGYVDSLHLRTVLCGRVRPWRLSASLLPSLPHWGKPAHRAWSLPHLPLVSSSPLGHPLAGKPSQEEPALWTCYSFQAAGTEESMPASSPHPWGGWENRRC